MKNYFKLIVALLFATNVFGQNLPSYLPKDGLVGWWPFNGNANDESGNGNHGTVNGAALTADRLGNSNSAYSFDGVSKYIVVKNITTNLESFTLSGWFASNSFKGSAFFQVGEDSGHGDCGGLAIGQGTGDFGSNGNQLIGINSCKNWIGTNVVIPELLKWNHIVIVKDSLNLKYFFNGKLIYSNQIFEPNKMPSTIFFGTRFFDANCAFDGLLDDIAYYSRSLNESEVQALYTGTPVTQNLPSYLPKDGLVGWWPFNGNANDESGNGNHGKVNGAKLSEDRNGLPNKSFIFDGLSNDVDCGNNKILELNNFSISLWYKVINKPNSPNEYVMVCKSDFNNNTLGYRMTLGSIPNNKPQFVWSQMGGGNPCGNYVESDSETNLNIWSNLICLKENNTLKIYVDGKLQSNTVNVCGEFSNSRPLLFGSKYDYNNVKNGFFNGHLDDIAIYNRALTEAEIQALYTGTPLCSTPPTPKVNSTVTTCAGNSISIEATGATGVETYNWYDVAEGGTPIATSQIFKTPVLNYGENKTYWVSITNGVCEGTRARVDVVVKELPTVKKPENYSVCAGDFIQSLNFALTPQGATNYWSNDNTTIGLPSSGMGALPGFKTPSNINSPIVSNITVTPSFNGCIGKSETFKIYVIPTPKVAITNLKPIVYTSDAPIALEGEPAGGTFTGEAIVGNIFTPAKTTLGKKSIEYKYVSKDGCGGSATASTIVVDTNGVVCTKYDTITVKETVYDTVLKITFKLTTGINISKTTSLSVYPNPTADNLIIDAADVTAMSGYRYQLLDALGKEIYSQLVTSKKTEISLKTLGAKGVYVLHVLDANNQSVVSKKIVLE